MPHDFPLSRFVPGSSRREFIRAIMYGVEEGGALQYMMKLKLMDRQT
jgi:hypothetical protein